MIYGLILLFVALIFACFYFHAKIESYFATQDFFKTMKKGEAQIEKKDEVTPLSDLVDHNNKKLDEPSSK